VLKCIGMPCRVRQPNRNLFSPKIYVSGESCLVVYLGEERYVLKVEEELSATGKDQEEREAKLLVTVKLSLDETQNTASCESTGHCTGSTSECSNGCFQERF